MYTNVMNEGKKTKTTNKTSRFVCLYSHSFSLFFIPFSFSFSIFSKNFFLFFSLSTHSLFPSLLLLFIWWNFSHFRILPLSTWHYGKRQRIAFNFLLLLLFVLFIWIPHLNRQQPNNVFVTRLDFAVFHRLRFFVTIAHDTHHTPKKERNRKKTIFQHQNVSVEHRLSRRTVRKIVVSARVYLTNIYNRKKRKDKIDTIKKKQI